MSQTLQPRRDTAANWTTANPVLEAGVMGVETDTDQYKFGDGATAWNSLPYVGGPDYTPGMATAVATNVLSAAAATVTITLPSGYKGFRIEAKLRGDAAALDFDPSLRLNGDTASNYQWQRFNAQGTGATASEQATPGSSIRAGSAPAASATADYYGHIIIEIPFPDMTTGWKDTIIRNGFAYGTASTDIRHETIWGIWRSTAAVTSVTFTASSGNIIAGSTFKIMGLK